MRQPFRLEPKLPVTAVKTYALAQPLASHWRRATCAEVACPHHLNGWATTVQEGSIEEATLGRAADGRIDGARRRYTRHPQGGGFVRYLFPPGQACFRAVTHRVPLEREPVYLVKGGDWRGNPRGEQRIHARGEHWVEDFATHQDALATRLGRG
jgi:hypothetical protein